MSLTRTRALVFLLAFFLPSGLNVDKHVVHTRSPGDAVKHLICGRLLEVPVPRKMNSSSSDVACALIHGCKDTLSGVQTEGIWDMTSFRDLLTIVLVRT